MNPPNMSIKLQPIWTANSMQPVGTKRQKCWLAECTAYVTPPNGGGEVVTATGLVEHKDKMRAVEHAMTECETKIRAVRNEGLEA